MGQEERLLRSGCCRAKDQFGEMIVEDRKDNEKLTHLRSSSVWPLGVPSRESPSQVTQMTLRGPNVS